WANQPQSWPVNTLALGNQSYGKGQLVSLLSLPANGDASLILAEALIAARLNIANGSDPSPISDTLTSADSLLTPYALPLPYSEPTSSANGQQMVSLASVLESYNHGQLTPDCTGGPAALTPTDVVAFAQVATITPTPTPTDGGVSVLVVTNTPTITPTY